MPNKQTMQQLNLGEFLTHWWIKQWIKNFGCHKSIWSGGPTIEDMLTCEDRKKEKEFQDRISKFLNQTSSQQEKKYNKNPHQLFESVE